MIGPKREKLTPRQESDAYELASVRDLGACQMVGHGSHVGSVQRDHRQNRDDFNTTVENLQLLCVAHHEWKTKHPKDANVEGWGCPSYESPAVWPARRLVDEVLEWIIYLPADQWIDDPTEKGIRIIDEIDAAARRAGLTAEQVN